MTHPPSPNTNPSPQPQPEQPRRRLLIRRWQLMYLILGMAIALASGIGYWRLRAYIYLRLVPQIERTLTERLDRPVDIGAVEAFSPISIRFGPGAVPPTPTDADQVTVDAVNVRFNPLELLFRRQLTPTITLVNAKLTIDQDRTGQWLHTRLKEVSPGPIQINIETVNFKDTAITLLPSPSLVSAANQLQPSRSPSSLLTPVTTPAVLLNAVTGQIRLRNDNRLIDLDLMGQAILGGTFALKGTINQDEAPLFKGQVETNRLSLAAFSPLGVAYLPRQFGSVTNGFLNSDVAVTLIDPTDTTNPFPSLTVQGDAEVWEMAVQLPSLPKPIQLKQAKFLFRGDRVNLRGMRFSYDNLKAGASGRVHFQDGYNITAKVSPASVTHILTALDVELPVETQGDFTAQLRLTGELDQPLLEGTVVNKRDIFVDQLRFDTVQSRFRITPEALEIGTIEALPQVGGAILGGGQVVFGLQPEIDLTVAIREIPGDDVLKKILGPRLNSAGSRRNRLPRWIDPATGQPIALGLLAANIDVKGPLNQLEAIAQFQAPEATFPTQGEAVFTNNVLVVNQVETRFSQGNITLDGRVDFAEQRWQAVAQINQLPLAQLPLGQLPFDRIPVSQIPRNPVISATELEELAQNPLKPPKLQRQRDRPSGRTNNDVTAENTPGNTADNDGSGADNRPPGNNQTTGNQSGTRTNSSSSPQQSSASSPSNSTSANAADNPGNSRRNSFDSSSQGDRNSLSEENAAVGTGNGDISGENGSNPNNLQPVESLPPVVQQLRGRIDGQISASGTLASLRPEAITLNGQLQLSELPFLNQPLFTAFQWNGSQLRIDDFTLPTLTAYGVIDLRFAPNWVPAVELFDLNIRVKDLDLTEWELPISDRLAVAGITDFDGRIFGTPSRPHVDALLQFDGLTINEVAFEPLIGPIRFSPDDGVFMDLRGDRDRISATLDPNFRPVEFALYYGITPQTITRVEGAIEPNSGGDRLRAEIQQFPLSVLNLKPASQLQLGAVGGVLNGNAVVDLSEWNWQAANPLDAIALTGTVAIAQPSLGYLRAECFQGSIKLTDGVADIRDGQLLLRQHSVVPNSPAEQSAPPTICPAVLTADESRYTINGRVAATPTPSFKGKVEIEQGQIQDWLQTLQFYNLNDIARGLKPAQLDRADDITLIPLPFPPSVAANPSNTTLLRQLQRYAEILALREQQRRQQLTEFALPQLQDLAGTFSGSVDLTTSLATGLTAQFDLSGSNWTWGPYTQPNQLIAQGELTNGTLTFLPLRFEAGDSRLNFAGSVGWNEAATGQFQATNLSVAWLRQFFKLPLNIDGHLNATAAITGNLRNPQARGNVTLSNASLNRTPIQSAEATFSYADARLGVIGKMLLQEEPSPSSADAEDDSQVAGLADSTPENAPDQPEREDTGADQADPTPLISLIGSLPYRLPFARVEPERDDIDLNLSVRDQGIALLNLLNEHFFWEDGQGLVTLKVGGTLRQTEEGIDFRPTVVGTAQVESATFSARVLPAPLTNVTGDVQFDGDRITVNTFQGRFSDGNFSASGVIPLLEPFTPQEIAQFTAAVAVPTPSNSPTPNPPPPLPTPPLPPNRRLLAMDLNSLVVNFKGLYNGGVDGQITIGGTALKPQLGGGITLSEGRVSLPDPTIVNQPTSVVVEQSSDWTGLIASPELTNLKVTLGKNLLITRLPLLNFVATGELLVNGPLQSDLRTIAPRGIISLHSGQVNLFTTQFNLDRSHNNVAIFTSRTGSDPFLDVQLETSVLEETRQPIADNSILSRAEIAETSTNDFSQFQTIRIQAKVYGLASQLFNSIELTSSPSRSETEIVTLIGGGFADTLGRSEGFVGIANLAGTALFTSLQTLLSNAVGFSDLRIFPTVITNLNQDEKDARPSSTLALAAELGFNLTRDLSISALQLLTVSEPTQYNLRYQINDELLLRGSTNFSDDSRIILEFETRF